MSSTTVEFENKEYVLDLTDKTIWLTEKQITYFYEVTQPTINEHIKNIYNDNELQSGCTYRKSLYKDTVGRDREIGEYNLDMVCHIGYRVRSDKGVELRTKATEALKQQHNPEVKTPELEDLIIMQAQSVKQLKLEVRTAQEDIKAIEIKQEELQVDVPIHENQRGYLYGKVHEIASETGYAPATIWRALKKKFGVASYRNLPRELFPDAKVWINNYQQNAQESMRARGEQVDFL